MFRFHWRLRTVIRAALLGMVLIAACGWSFARLAGAQAEPKGEFFVEPIPIDPEAKAVLELTGVQSFAFRYRLPSDHKLVLTFLAENEGTEKVLDEFSSVIEVAEMKGEINTGVVRLTRIDPAGTNEGYQGKVRWIRNVADVTRSQWAFEPRGLTPLPSWKELESIKNPQVDKEYVVLDVKRYDNNIRGIYPYTPAAFRLRIKFKYSRLAARDRPGDNFERQYDEKR